MTSQSADDLPQCPRCRKVEGVAEERHTGSLLRWFVCRLCGYVWAVGAQGV